MKFDETDEIKKFREITNQFMLFDLDAIRLCEDYLQVAHIWDDLYDKDKELTSQEINKAFCNALGNIPGNPLYQDHVQTFSALSLITAMTWQIANKFEREGNQDEKLGAFILRNSLMNLIYFIMLVVGVKHHDETWGIDLGEYFFSAMFKDLHGKYEVFLKEMGDGKNKSASGIQGSSGKNS